MSNPNILLAKSKKEGRDPVTLQSHLEDTEKAAREIFNLDNRWGRNWCRFFKISEKNDQERFLLNLRIAALFHDIGKANEDFQNAVLGKLRKDERQTIHHAHLSALILHLPEVRGWLSDNKQLDLEIITAAVLSHHIKASGNRKKKWFWMRPFGEKNRICLFDFHDEINKVFDNIKNIAGLKTLRLNYQFWEKENPIWQQAEENGWEAAEDFDTDLLEDLNRNRLLIAVKSALIAADAVSSGLVREGFLKSNFTNWIKEKTERAKFTKDEVSKKILIPKAKDILKDDKKAKQRELIKSETDETDNLAVWNEALDKYLWNDFQKESANLGNRALLLAACGSGKTIAAWKWAEAQAANPDCEIGKVIFLYPTRGTATEGFKDYVGYAPADEASLNHGQSKYELEGIKENPTDVTRDKDYETNARLFALGFWGKRYFSATVDQFLSFLEHSYKSLCLLPVLADSAVIIDEIHSFDKRMFNNLICFLQHFDVPVLCMTATLPPSRIENLKKIEGLRVYPDKDEFEKLEDLKKAENHERYNLEIIENEDFKEREKRALDIAIKEYDNGKGNRILWVVNTVACCQRIAVCLKKDFGIDALVYHSRYCLEDRKEHHNETVAAFKQRVDAKIAITTQVCEMSLDLDADVLITEVAPIPSLVQRFGRSNRHLDEKPKNFRARLVVYMPKDAAPYDEDLDLKPAFEFLRDLPPKDISQSLLAEKLKEYVPRERQSEGEFAPFLNSGYFAVPGNFREIDNFTNPCILSGESLKKVKDCIANKQPIDAYIVSVPNETKNRNGWIMTEKIIEDLTNKGEKNWIPKYLNVADRKFYSKEYGFITNLDLLNELEGEDE